MINNKKGDGLIMVDLSIFFSYFFKNPFTLAGICVLIFSIYVGIIKCLTSHSCQDLGRFLKIPVITFILLLSFFTTMIKAGNEANKQNVKTTEQMAIEKIKDGKIALEENTDVIVKKNNI